MKSTRMCLLTDLRCLLKSRPVTPARRLPTSGRPKCPAGLMLILAACAAASAADPRIGWRGDGTGNFPDANPPVKWSATENVLWKTPMPGRSNSAPIVVADRVFTCSEPSTLLCVSAGDGKVLWSDTVTYFDYVPEDDPEAAEIMAKWKLAKTEDERKALKKDILRCDYFEMPSVMGEHFGFILEYTLPTPTSDGKHVYVVYGTGMCAAYDLDGNRKWVRALDKPRSATGYAASPLLAGGQLLVNIGGFLHGLDPANGRIVWRTAHKECYGSPVRARVGDTEAAVMPKGDIFRASDGKKLASRASTNYYQSALVHGDVVYSMRSDSFSDEDGSPRMMAVRLKPAPDGGITTEKLWETKEPSGFSSPVCADGLLYNSVNKVGLSVFEAATGQVVYSRKLSFGNVENFCSITRAGPYLYIPDQSGRTWVVQLGREYKEVGLNQLCDKGDQMIGAPLFVGNRLYIRTHRFLFCKGNK